MFEIPHRAKPGTKRESYSFLPDKRQYSMAGMAGCNRPFSTVSIHRDNLQHMILLPDHSTSQSEQLLSYRIFNTRKSSSVCGRYCPKRNFASLLEIVIECQ